MSKKTILVFGGNGFIGAECVEYLLDNNDDYELVLVNRGNWDDWDARSRIKERIHENIVCDRKTDSLQKALAHYLNRENFQFEAVIDFSAFKSCVVKNAINEIPADKIKLYILISTDSVYEVSVDKEVHDGEKLVLNETDSIRPVSKSERERLKEFDSYGHHKFKCEEEIFKQAPNGFPYVILRLPDVIGKRDSTNRFWFYQMYLQYLDYVNPNTDIEIPIAKFYFNKKTSYVNVKDVARVVNQLLKSSIKNEIFNLGFNEELSVVEILKLVASLIRPGLEDKIKCSPVENIADYIYEPFPSVTKGPVNTEKVKSVLNFEPSNLIEVFKESVEFYNEAFLKYPQMRRVIEKDLKKELIKSPEDRAKFLKFIENYSK